MLRYLNREVYEDIAEEFEKEYLRENTVTNINNENITEEKIINILNTVINKCIIKNESKWHESNIIDNSKNYVESNIRSTSVNQLEMVLRNISEKEENVQNIKLLRYINREVYENIAEEFVKEYSVIAMDSKSIAKEYMERNSATSGDTESISTEYLKENPVTNIESENITEEQIINVLNNVINKCIVQNESKWNESDIINNSNNYIENDIRSSSVNQLEMVLRNINEKEENVWNIKLLRYINREVYENIAEEFVKEYSVIAMDSKSIAKEYLKEISITNMYNENITEEQIINILNNVINKCIKKNESKWNESNITNNSKNYVESDIRSTSINKLQMVLRNISEKEENVWNIKLLSYIDRELYEDIAEEFVKEYLKENSVTNMDNENITEEQIINILNNVINKRIVQNESKWHESDIINNSKNNIENDTRSTSVNQLEMVLNNINKKEKNTQIINLLNYINTELYEDIAEEFVKEYSILSKDSESILKESVERNSATSKDRESILKEYFKENSVTNMESENITEEQIINILNNVINKCIVENESKWHESDIIKNSNNYIENDIRSSSVNQLEMVLNNENKVSSFFNSIINNKTQNNIINTNIMSSGTKQADIVYKVENKEYEDNTFSGNKSNSTTYVRNIKENNNNTENTDLKNKILNYSENVEQRIITNKRDVELQSVVKENIQREIKSITEQVYNRIEKKLQNEKKRRGI